MYVFDTFVLVALCRKSRYIYFYQSKFYITHEMMRARAPFFILSMDVVVDACVGR